MFGRVYLTVSNIVIILVRIILSHLPCVFILRHSKTLASRFSPNQLIVGLAAPMRGRVFSTLVVILSFNHSFCPNFFNVSVDLKTRWSRERSLSKSYWKEICHRQCFNKLQTHTFYLSSFCHLLEIILDSLATKNFLNQLSTLYKQQIQI